MKTIKSITPALVIVFLITLCFSCGKGGDNNTDIYIPDINGNWINQANANDQFSFFDAPVNSAPSGSFSAHELISGSVIADVAGTFDHSKVSFIITFADNSKPAVTYTGTISGTGANQKMALSGSAGKLNLTKQ